MDLPSPANSFQQAHALHLAYSYHHQTGRLLGDWPIDDPHLGQKLWDAPFVQLSHGTEADPLFNYGNRSALERFALSWQKMVGMPSRYSAEIPERSERERLLETVLKKGFIDDYQGVRITSDGTRFRIHQATVWTVTDSEGNPRGQAACFDQWESIESILD